MRCVQPGGGWLVACALWWGRLRGRWLRRWRPSYVARQRALRQGACASCEHDPVDARDLIRVQNVCGWRWPDSASVPFRDRFGLVRLGRPELLAALALSLGFCGSGVAVAESLGWAIVAPLLIVAVLPFAFACWFFRDPHRVPPRDSSARTVLSPADGVVDDLRVEPSHEFFAGPALRIGIYLSVFDVHVQRAPVAGEVMRSEYRPGRHAPTVRRGFTDANEQLLTWFRSDNGTPIVVRQVAGPFARRICTVLAVGERVAAGQRFGVIKFGSRCELWLPAAAVTDQVVHLGQRVRAGESVLALTSRDFASRTDAHAATVGAQPRRSNAGC